MPYVNLRDVPTLAQQHTCLVVAVTASWCGYCKRLKKVYPLAAAEAPDDVLFVYAEDQKDDAMAPYEVAGFPHIMTWIQGRKRGKGPELSEGVYTGGKSKKELVDLALLIQKQAS